MPQAICLAPDMAIVEAARRILQSQLENIEPSARSIQSNNPETRIEGIHDMRVAIRRSFSALECFSPWLSRKWAKKYGGDFQKLLQPLAKARDADIILENISQLARDNSLDNSGILDNIQKKQCRRHDKLVKVLDSSFADIYSRKLTELQAADANIVMCAAAHNTDRPVNLYRLQDSLALILFQAASAFTSWHNTCPVVPDLEADLAICDEEIMHCIRISARHLRYCLEFFASITGYSALSTITELRRLQDILGSWHDLLITDRYLNKLDKDGETSGQLEKLVADAGVRKQEKADSFRQVWTDYNAGWAYQNIRKSLNNAYKPGSRK